MDDQEYGRLDDRTIAAEERGRLRLDTAMARIDGKFDLIIREDSQALRIGIGGFSSGQMYQDAAHSPGAAPTKP